MKEVNEIKQVRDNILNTLVLDIFDPKDFREIMLSESNYQFYINEIFKNNSGKNLKDLLILADNMKMAILEDNMYYQISVNNILSFFVLDEFYNNTILKEISNVIIVDKPDVIKSFIICQMFDKDNIKSNNEDEEKVLMPTVKFNMIKKILHINDKTITHEYDLCQSILEDINLVSEEISKASKIILEYIEKNFLDELIKFSNTYNSDSLIVDVTERCPHNDILINLMDISAHIYNETRIGAANTIIINPKNIHLFDELNYETSDNSSINSGRWKVISSEFLDESIILCLYRSDDFARACFPIGFYQPFRFTFPGGIVCRNTDFKPIRRNFCGIINLVEDVPRPIREPRNERELQLRHEIVNDYGVPPELLKKYVVEYK